MKTAIYISGITGLMLLLFGLLGVFLESKHITLLFITGIVLILVIYFPLMIIERRLHDKKINKIIESYKGSDKKQVDLKKGRSDNKGWSMNNSPFRDRKSGVTWGGGNIKGSEASRGSRRSFLK